MKSDAEFDMERLSFVTYKSSTVKPASANLRYL